MTRNMEVLSKETQAHIEEAYFTLCSALREAADEAVERKNAYLVHALIETTLKLHGQQRTIMRRISG